MLTTCWGLPAPGSPKITSRRTFAKRPQQERELGSRLGSSHQRHPCARDGAVLPRLSASVVQTMGEGRVWSSCDDPGGPAHLREAFEFQSPPPHLGFRRRIARRRGMWVESLTFDRNKLMNSASIAILQIVSTSLDPK